MRFLDRLLRRPRAEPQVGPQGEEYEILKAERERAEANDAFSENVIKKAGHRGLPFLDDPYE